MNHKPAVLVLEDGTVFKGASVGKIGTVSGEFCFNTGMTGYQEIFTDPSYAGQIMVMTNALIGNYGTLKGESESEKIQIAGMVCRNFVTDFSRDKADSSLHDYCIDHQLVAIDNIDTRALVRHIRSKGSMNGIISSETEDVDSLKNKLADTPSMLGLELSTKVATKEIYNVGSPGAKHKVAVLDLGIKKSILENLAKRDFYLQVFPPKTSFEEMYKWKPDAFFVSNGPGDPAACQYAIQPIKEALNQKIPLFGICLGHQLLARTMGVDTYKMDRGHRGINHPVKNLLNGKCEITSQNHGFAVVEDEVRKHQDLEITHVNLNDQTVEGIRLKQQPAFSIQYHPEANPGPHDAHYLFDYFKQMVNEGV